MPGTEAPGSRHGSAPDTRIGSRDLPLITAADLAARLDDPRLRIVDLRWALGDPGAGRRAYAAGHLPGAIFLDLESDLADPRGLGAPGRHPLPSPARFASRLGAAGIGDDDLLVAYDDAAGSVASRLWWMLDDLGHNRLSRRGGVAVLDGGWPAWLAAGFPTSTALPSLAPAQLQLAERWSRVIEREALRSRLGTVRLLDARAGERYRGEIEPIDPAAGHIPTSVSAPWGGNVDAELRMRDPQALRLRFAELGLAPAGDPGAEGADGVEVVTSCGSGVTACHNALAMRIAGLPDPTLYPGSFSDWSRSGLPVATGAQPGGPPISAASHAGGPDSEP